MKKSQNKAPAKKAKKKEKTVPFVKGDFIISMGEVFYKGNKVGTLTYEYKHGYHPAVLLDLEKATKTLGITRVGSHVRWFERDEPDLLNKVVKAAAEIMLKQVLDHL